MQKAESKKMKNIFIITKREYLTQVKKKSFLILTMLAPLLLAGFIALITFMFKANETQTKLSVIDKSGIFNTQLKSDNDIKYTFVPTETEKSLLVALKNVEDMDGVLVIPANTDNNLDILEKNSKLYINKKIGFDAQMKISSQLSEVIKKEKIKKLGLTEGQLSALDQKFMIATENVVDKAKQDDNFAFGVKSVMSMSLMYIIFMFIMIYGVRVMRSVLEEKNNRVVEILISSVKPFELMMGKILGVTLVALTQFAIWITMSVVAASIFNNNYTPAIAQNADNPMAKIGGIKEMLTLVFHNLLSLNYGMIIFVFIAFFFLGYIFYSSMYAAIGSAVDNETETQQFTIFGILPLILGMYGSFSIMNNPEGPMAFWLSIIPLTSPVAMVARIPFGVPVWQIVLSIFLLVVFTLGMVYIAAKIYRVGILMYGNKATFKELWKWIRTS